MTDWLCAFAKKEIIVSTANVTNANLIALLENEN
jgi:hypothetical protein